MKYGFVKVAAATPRIRVADVRYNSENICRMLSQMQEGGAEVAVFPEL